MRRRILARIFLLDLISLAVGMAVASLAVFGTLLPWEAPAADLRGRSVFPMLSFLLAGMVLGSWVTARTIAKGVPRPSYGRAVSIALITVAFAPISIVFLRAEYFSRSYILVTGVSMLVLGLVHRAVARSRPWTDSMILVTREKKLIDDLVEAPHTAVIDVYDPGTAEVPSPPTDGVTLAVDLRAVLSEPMARFVSSSNLAGYRIRPLVDVYEEHTGRLAIVHLAEGWELRTPVERSSGYAIAKRVLDSALVLIFLPLVALISLFVALAVKLDSPGPAIFKQRRVGRNGELFTAYKFRTMRPDAERDGPQLALPDDPRLTRTGRWLRRFRADELLQLWNVLKGDLSLVGPRPEQPVFVEKFTESIPFYEHRHLVRPGLTGWAQVNYGYADDEADTVEKLTFDLYYVKHMSLWLDLHILGKSFWTVISGFGAQ